MSFITKILLSQLVDHLPNLEKKNEIRKGMFIENGALKAQQYITRNQKEAWNAWLPIQY